MAEKEEEAYIPEDPDMTAENQDFRTEFEHTLAFNMMEEQSEARIDSQLIKEKRKQK